MKNRLTAIKNGGKSIVRTPVKSLLFVLLLTGLGALLAAALCVYSAARTYLEECDTYFHTVAELEYIGRDYPDPFVYDSALEKAVGENKAQLEALLQSEAVLSFEADSGALAVFQDLHRTDAELADPEAAVLLIFLTAYDPVSEAYTGIISESLYSRVDQTKKMAFIRIEEQPDAPIQKNKTYAVCGHFIEGKSSYVWFMAESFTMKEADGSTLTLPPYTRAAGGELAEDSPYRRAAELLHRQNDSCPLQRTACLEDFLPFHEEQTSVTSGRSFTAEEYAGKEKVCVIPNRIAYMFQLEPGDRLSFAILETKGDVYGQAGLLEAEEESYEVVGIYAENAEDPYRIYIPDAAAGQGTIRAGNGYRLGQFRLRNSQAEAFYAQAEPLFDKGFRLSIYDHGYAAAAEPFQELRFIALLFLLICLILTAAVLAAQGQLFVSRQREAAATMTALGSGKMHVLLYFLTGTLCLTVPAALAGTWVGRRLEGRVLNILKDFAVRMSTRDYRYSSSRITVTRTLDFSPVTNDAVYRLAGGILIGGALLTAAFFVLLALKEKKVRKKRKKRVPVNGRTSRLHGFFKYALLSIRRGGLRTAAVIAVAVIAALFFGQLTDSSEAYRTQLESVRDNSVVKGYVTNRTGQRMNGLVLKEKDVRPLSASAYTEFVNLTDTAANVRYLGVSVLADGTEQELPPFEPPQSSFAVETLFNQLAREPLWVSTSSVSGHPMFFYTPAQEIRWLEGYGEEDFSAGNPQLICALSATMAERNGIHLGDQVRFLFATSLWGGIQFRTVDLKVAALYRSSLDEETVLSPLDLTKLQALSFYGRRLFDGTYDSFVFSLKSARELDAFRQELEDNGFRQVRDSSRTNPFVVILDQTYLQTTASMERQIQYIDVLYAALYVLAGIIAAILAYLMTAARRNELAVMRLLGTKTFRIFLNAAAEQVLLCGTGLGIGTLLHVLLGRTVRPLHGLLLALYFVIWCVSASAAALKELSAPLQASLQEAE